MIPGWPAEAPELPQLVQILRLGQACGLRVTHAVPGHFRALATLMTPEMTPNRTASERKLLRASPRSTPKASPAAQIRKRVFRDT